MSAAGSSSPAAAGSSSSSSASGPPKPQQEFGTLWIQDKNGVSQMLRVLHATPTKLSAAAGGEGGSGIAAAAGGSGPVSVVRAVMKPTPPSQRVALQQQAQVLRRTVHLQASPRRLLVANQALGATCRPLTPKRRVLPTRLQAVAQQPSPRLNSAPPATSSASPGAHINAIRSRNSYISPILDHSGARKRQNLDDLWSDTKRRRTDKSSKGLRHFSMKVCQKVRAKGTTTYNEVADELVAEYSDPRTCEASVDQPYDQKNIRRRVYDALNVLMAMHIISKEKKEIRWLGLPTNALQDCKQLEREKAERMHRINVKTQQLKDLLLQQIAFKRLVERNREAEQVHGPPLASSTVQLPFIVVNTDKKTVIDCSISNDKMEYLFNFDDTFEIHDDIEVLKRMGMALGLERGDCSAQDVQLARSLVAPALAPYIDQLGREGALTLQSVELEAAVDDEQRPSSITPSIDVDSDDDAELDEDEEDPVPETEPSDD